ncbi:glycosyltransferase family 39 protein [Lutibacter sp. Hel_I_33_5]|uniref:ArnT family glycosyltransferase n=1 Tax=Lutibacter sp. Hel_I_33_5 TaxID=1566289 RepID=UPI001648F0DB|nr:glycosyltransferase family 39 protein [Lutibacter sp. Hel_I_33_5]
MNFFQIATTELTSDEAYYWFYSQELDWGYYDHPPLISLLINFGKLFFESEIAVRFGNVLLLSIALYFLFKIRPWTRKEKHFLYLIILGFPLLNYITFIAFPDSSLVALSMAFLYYYKQFLERSSKKNMFILSIIIALMFYAKYHAILFIGFVIISNLKLLTNKYFYTALALVIVFYLPHILWQIDHNFASLKFHLVGRSNPFQTRFFGEFISQQIPIIGLGLIWIPFIFKTKNQFEKTLKFIAIGSFLFFLFSSLKGFVHIHWTSIAIFPIIILSAKYYSSLKKKTLFYSLVLPFVFLLLIIRLYLSFQIFPSNKLGTDYYHDRNLWAEDITKISQGKPVLFDAGNESLREAPMYSFYAKKLGIAMFPGEFKKSQYQIWQYEDSIQNKDIMLIKRHSFNTSIDLKTRMGKTIHYKLIDNFTSFNNIKIDFNPKDISLKKDVLSGFITLKNHRNKTINISSSKIYISIIGKEKRDDNLRNLEENSILINPNQSKKIEFKVTSKNIKGDYKIAFGFINKNMNWSINSTRKNINFD